MQKLLLEILLLITPGANRMPMASGIKIPVKTDISIQPYSPDKKPSFFYLRQIDPEAIRSHLKITGREKEVKANIRALKKRETAFERVDVSYAEILANIKTLSEWKATQDKIRKGEVKNVQLAKLSMEENMHKMRLELARKYGTPEEYQKELESFRKFEAFKAHFLKNKEVRR